MKLWRNLIILLVCIGLLGGAYFFLTSTDGSQQGEEAVSPSPSASEDTSVVLIDAAFEDVETLELSFENEKAVYVPDKSAEESETGKNTWKLTSHEIEDGVLDMEAISENAENLIQITASSTVEVNPTDLEKYGLDEPESTMTLNLKDGTVYTLSLGDISTTVGRYFAYSKENATVYTLDNLTSGALRKRLGDFRASMSYNFPTTGVTDLIIERDGEDVIEFETNAERVQDLFAAKFGSFVMISPYNDYGGHSANLETMFYKPLANVNFKSINVLDTENYAEYGLDEPWARIWMKYTISAEESGTGEEEVAEKELLISPLKGGKYYAKLADYDGIFEFSRSTFEFVETLDPFYLISKISFTTYIQTVDTINIWFEDGEEALVEIKTIPGETEDDDVTYEHVINGTTALKNTGNIFYRHIIGFAFDGIYAGTGKPSGDSILKMQINLTNGTSKTLEFIPINDRECSYTLNGETNFTIKTATVRTTMEKMKSIIADPTAATTE